MSEKKIKYIAKFLVRSPDAPGYVGEHSPLPSTIGTQERKKN